MGFDKASGLSVFYGNVDEVENHGRNVKLLIMS